MALDAPRIARDARPGEDAHVVDAAEPEPGTPPRTFPDLPVESPGLLIWREEGTSMLSFPRLTETPYDLVPEGVDWRDYHPLASGDLVHFDEFDVVRVGESGEVWRVSPCLPYRVASARTTELRQPNRVVVFCSGSDHTPAGARVLDSADGRLVLEHDGIVEALGEGLYRTEERSADEWWVVDEAGRSVGGPYSGFVRAVAGEWMIVADGGLQLVHMRHGPVGTAMEGVRAGFTDDGVMTIERGEVERAVQLHNVVFHNPRTGESEVVGSCAVDGTAFLTLPGRRVLISCASGVMDRLAFNIIGDDVRDTVQRSEHLLVSRSGDYLLMQEVLTELTWRLYDLNGIELAEGDGLAQFFGHNGLF